MSNKPTEPQHNICFSKEGKEIGRLSWDNGILEFSGEMEDSAKIFFDFLKKLSRDGLSVFGSVGE